MAAQAILTMLKIFAFKDRKDDHCGRHRGYVLSGR